MRFETFSEKQALALTWWSDSSPYLGYGNTDYTNLYGDYAQVINAYPVTAVSSKGSYVEDVYSYTIGEYPNDGAENGYYYVSIGKAATVSVRIVTGSYTGTGTYGSSNPNSVILGFIPKLFICGNEGLLMIAINPYGTYILIKGTQNGYNSIQFGSTVKWNNSYSASCQLNDTGTKFYYAAIG